MFNIIIPLLAQPPEIYGKIVKHIFKLYDKDPRDLLPDNWISPPQQEPQEQPLIVPAGAAQSEAIQNVPAQETPLPPPLQEAQEAQTVAPRVELPKEGSVAQRIIGRLTAPFR